VRSGEARRLLLEELPPDIPERVHACTRNLEALSRGDRCDAPRYRRESASGGFVDP
jgi:hypothetical protein